MAAGLQVLVTLPAGLDEAPVAERALAAGVRVYPLATYRARARPGRTGGVRARLRLGAARRAELGIRLLAESIEDLPVRTVAADEWVRRTAPVSRMFGS